MKRPGKKGPRDRGTEHIADLLREAVPPVKELGDASHDLWPEMARRMRAEAVATPVKVRVPWFDWALAGGLVALLVLFPTWIPVLLYYL